jgi:hypothetical protein
MINTQCQADTQPQVDNAWGGSTYTYPYGHVCPYCGRCRGCGGHPYPTNPYSWPTYPWNQPIWCGTTNVGSTSNDQYQVWN